MALTDLYGCRERVALRKLGNPKGFQFFRWQCVGDDAVVLTGCVVDSVFTKGARKGRPKYDGEPRTVVVTDAEESAEKTAYERETGNCSACMGRKTEFASADASGSRYRHCRKCQGSGCASPVREEPAR